MKRNDALYKVMIERIRRGELTRAQAAADYGINPATLNVWIARSKEGLPKMTQKVRAGASKHWPVATKPARAPSYLTAFRRAVERAVEEMVKDAQNPTTKTPPTTQSIGETLQLVVVQALKKYTP